MELIIYVSNESDLRAAEQILSEAGTLANNIQTQVINLIGAQRDGIPAEVLQVMVLKKTGTFPLTVIDAKPVLSGKLPTVAELKDLAVKGVDAPAVLVNRADSAVDFPTLSRVHISLDVSNIQNSLKFYKILFNAEPIKQRDDYVKFELFEPPLNITLNQFSHHQFDGHGSEAVNHFGIQVKSTDAVLEAKERYLRAGFKVEEEVATACCYAVQNKIWVADPDGNSWEVFVVTEANAEEGCGPDCICYRELEPSFANETLAS